MFQKPGIRIQESESSESTDPDCFRDNSLSAGIMQNKTTKAFYSVSLSAGGIGIGIECGS
jgi:hypothetical protein